MKNAPNPVRRFPEMKLALVVIGSMLLLIQSFLPVLTEDPGSYWLLWLLTAVGFKLSICFWYHYDRRERERPASILFYPAIFIFGWLALICYLFKSRGPQAGLIALVIAFFLWIALLCLGAMLPQFGLS